MSNQLKGALYRALKAEDVPLEKPYAQYTVQELESAYGLLATGDPAVPADPMTHQANVDFAAKAQAAATQPQPVRVSRQPAQVQRPQPPAPADPYADVPRLRRDEREMAGQRINQLKEGEALRVDPDTNFVWFQEEVTKPAFPKPRGRRVMTYVETGVRVDRAKEGDYVESFEVAGNEQARTAEVKVTLPSYQVGCYKDPRFPFKIHVYQDNTGFDREEIEKFWGGRELVPSWVKKKYVENVLCYDMGSVITEINREHRDLVLQAQRGAR